MRFHLLPVASALFLIYVRRGFQDVECILIFIVLQFVSRTYDRINGRRQKEKTGYQKNIFHSYFKLPDGFGSGQKAIRKPFGASFSRFIPFRNTINIDTAIWKTISPFKWVLHHDRDALNLFTFLAGEWPSTISGIRLVCDSNGVFHEVQEYELYELIILIHISHLWRMHFTCKLPDARCIPKLPNSNPRTLGKAFSAF